MKAKSAASVTLLSSGEGLLTVGQAERVEGSCVDRSGAWGIPQCVPTHRDLLGYREPFLILVVVQEGLGKFRKVILRKSC